MFSYYRNGQKVFVDAVDDEWGIVEAVGQIVYTNDNGAMVHVESLGKFGDDIFCRYDEIAPVD